MVIRGRRRVRRLRWRWRRRSRIDGVAYDWITLEEWFLVVLCWEKINQSEDLEKVVADSYGVFFLDCSL